MVLQPQPRDLNRRIERDKQKKFLPNAVTQMFKDCVTLAVFDRIRLGFPDRPDNFSRPNAAGFLRLPFLPKNS